MNLTELEFVLPESNLQALISGYWQHVPSQAEERDGGNIVQPAEGGYSFFEPRKIVVRDHKHVFFQKDWDALGAGDLSPFDLGWLTGQIDTQQKKNV